MVTWLALVGLLADFFGGLMLAYEVIRTWQEPVAPEELRTLVHDLALAVLGEKPPADAERRALLNRVSRWAMHRGAADAQASMRSATSHLWGWIGLALVSLGFILQGVGAAIQIWTTP
jgi:hypothetical protein